MHHTFLSMMQPYDVIVCCIKVGGNTGCITKWYTPLVSETMIHINGGDKTDLKTYVSKDFRVWLGLSSDIEPFRPTF